MGIFKAFIVSSLFRLLMPRKRRGTRNRAASSVAEDTTHTAVVEAAASVADAADATNNVVSGGDDDENDNDDDTSDLRRTRPRLASSSTLTSSETEINRIVVTNATIPCVVRLRVYPRLGNDTCFLIDFNSHRTRQSFDGTFAVRKVSILAQLKTFEPTIENIQFSRATSDDKLPWQAVKREIDYLLVKVDAIDNDIYCTDIMVLIVPEEYSEPQSASSTTSSSSVMSTSSTTSTANDAPYVAPINMLYKHQKVTLGMIFERYEAWNHIRSYVTPSGRAGDRTNAQMRAILNIDRTTHLSDEKIYNKYTTEQRNDPTIRAQAK